MGEVLHILKRWPCDGGMGMVAGLHAKRSDRTTAFPQRVIGLSSNRQLWCPVGLMRRRLAVPAETTARAQLFYNGYGLDWVPGKRSRTAKWVYLHSDFPGLDKFMGYLSQFADVIVTVNPMLTQRLRTSLSKFPPEAICTLPLPVDDPPVRGEETVRRSLTIGYAGRIQVKQKRLDRLIPFLRTLDSLQLNYSMELLGTGEDLGYLENLLAGNSRVTFHGYKQGRAYWEIISKWKYMVFLSDYEGLPVSLLEGLKAGVLPVYPDFYSGQDCFCNAADASHYLYQKGNPESAARLIAANEMDLDSATVSRMLHHSSLLLQDHNPDDYSSRFNQLLGKDFNPLTKTAKGFPAIYPVWAYNRFYARLQGGS